jgi:hypothetical protein
MPDRGIPEKSSFGARETHTREWHILIASKKRKLPPQATTKEKDQSLPSRHLIGLREGKEDRKPLARSNKCGMLRTLSREKKRPRPRPCSYATCVSIIIKRRFVHVGFFFSFLSFGVVISLTGPVCAFVAVACK